MNLRCNNESLADPGRPRTLDPLSHQTSEKSYTPYKWRIQDFPQGGAPTAKIAIIFQIFAKNCMKMKEFGPPGGARIPGAPPLDPPMPIYQETNGSNCTETSRMTPEMDMIFVDF